jgi:hypothetical protein
MVVVYYPWVSGLDRFTEIHYSLRSLQMHAKFDYQVVIVGDDPCVKFDYIHLPHQRNWDGRHGENLRDAISKMKMFIEWAKNNNMHDFIRMYDDIYLLRDITLEEIKLVKVMEQLHDDTWIYKKEINRSCSLIWWYQLKKTYYALKHVRHQVWNTESHCPEFFEVAMMDFLLMQFRVGEQELLTSTLYYNYWRCVEAGKMVRASDVKAGFYGRSGFKALNTKTVVAAVEGKCFLNHNDQGLRDPLQNFIVRRFQ